MPFVHFVKKQRGHSRCERADQHHQRRQRRVDKALRLRFGDPLPDLVILDLMMPKRDGFEVCRNIRAQNIMIPILVLTARESTDDKVRALDVGADDYLVKPFALGELVARLRAVVRRAHGRAHRPAQLRARGGARRR